MTRNFLSILAALLLSVGMMQAQQTDALIIEDDMTVDAEQNAQWRTGQEKYPAKPKSMWELGVNVGHAFISGDVEASGLSGFGVGLTFRKAINYVLSIRFGGQYTLSKGYDARSTRFSTFQNERTYQQADNQSALAAYDGDVIHRNYKTSIFSVNVEAVLNVGNILFHQARNKWNGYVAVGLGVNIPDVKLDLLNGSSTTYNFAGVTSGLDLTTADGRKDARSNLKDLLDGDYETEGGVENTIAKFGDEKNVLPHVTLGVGISRKLSDKINLGIEHQVILSDNDLYDGFELRNSLDESNNKDVPHYTSIRLGINLGNAEEKTEPLYWLNPLDAPYSDLAELKQRPKFDLTDSDGDGVIDMIDQEVNSPAGAPVDTRGVTRDSDGDGIADHLDQEPYSPPGFEVGPDGIAMVPDYMTEEDVERIIDRRPKPKIEWFLPMVHFDLDKYYIKPEFYGQLHHVATIMKTHPNLKIVAHGYADNRNPDDYNNVLSFNRAQATADYLVSKYNIPRDRLMVMYGGEMQPLAENLPDNHRTTIDEEVKHYMNRRVEFRVAGEGDSNMSRPEGPEAGKNTPGSSRPGSKYSGNKNSGY